MASLSIHEPLALAEKQERMAKSLADDILAFSDIAAAVAKYDDQNQAAQFDAIVKEEISIRNDLNFSASAIRALVDRARNGQVGTSEQVISWYIDKMNELKAAMGGDKAAAKSAEYLEYRRIVWTALHPDEPMMEEGGVDEDIAVMATGEESFICPLTSAELKEPMKSTTCPHVYSKDALMKYLQGRRKPCPMAGCSAYIDPNTVVPDAITKRKMTSKKRKRPESSDDVTDL